MLLFQGTDYSTGLVASQYAMSAMYTGGDNYIISRPPASTTAPPTTVSNLATELDSFYSDIAALEPQPPPVEPPLPPPDVTAPVSPPQQQPPSSSPPPDAVVNKKRKKVSLFLLYSYSKWIISYLINRLIMPRIIPSTDFIFF